MTETVEKPTVAHLVGTYYNLTENWIHTQIEYLSLYRSLVLTWRTKNLNDQKKPEYYALLERSKLESLTNRVLRRLLGYYPSFYYVIRQQQAQLIHAHFGFMGYFALPLVRATRLPLITTFYGHDASRLPQQNPDWRQYYSRLFQQGTRFLVEGPHLGQQLQNLGCPAEKITLHHLGIELTELPLKPRTLKPGESLRLLAAGRFTEKKGLVYAVEAVARLLNRGIDVHLTLIGDATVSEESQATKCQILKTIAENNLTERVTLAGMQPHHQLKQAYYDHHIFLAPSVHASEGNNEGGAPVTLIEASATGMPVVATYHCDIPEVVQDGVSGLLASERDSETLANHVAALMTHPDQLVRLGQAGRQYIETEYDAQKQGERLARIYNTLINGRSSRRKQ